MHYSWIKSINWRAVLEQDRALTYPKRENLIEPNHVKRIHLDVRHSISGYFKVSRDVTGQYLLMSMTE